MKALRGIPACHEESQSTSAAAGPIERPPPADNYSHSAGRQRPGFHRLAHGSIVSGEPRITFYLLL
jgi:hypothetical protein